MKAKIVLMIGILAAALSAAPRTLPCSPPLPQDVCAMQERIYLQTDFKNTEEVRSLMVGLKDLLITHDGASTFIREHVLALVDHVIEQAHSVRAPWQILSAVAGQDLLFPMGKTLREYEKQHGEILPMDWE